MIYYLVLMNMEQIVEICSYDNAEAQADYLRTFSEREYYLRTPMYTHVIAHTEIR